MNKNDLLRELSVYQAFDATEAAFLAQTIAFVQANDQFWQRTTLEGHLTGSAWVLSPDQSQVLLIHHAKLDRWLQPGGHADATDESLLETARREAQEECGMAHLTLLQPGIFDIDIHTIPTKGHEPEHLHYDIRFVFSTDNQAENAHDQLEIKAVQWVPIETLQKESVPSSLRRMALKTALISVVPSP
jgi:8-oxo-dGTP pyrophosphatase MutT (NUDIX family)